MTKERAIQLMEQGKKVTHRFFSNTEYITIKDGKILTEEGYSCTQKFFWADRTLKEWDHDWEEFKESPSVNDPSVLVEALEKIIALPGEWNEAKQLARKTLADFLYPGMNNEVKAQYNTQSLSSIEESGLKEGDATEFYSGDIVACADRILRDKGASNKDVLEGIEQAVKDLKSQYRIVKL